MVNVEAVGRSLLGLSARTKTLAAITIALLLAVALAIALYANANQGVAVYGGQSFAPQQVDEISRTLAALGIPYTAGKDSVFVPKGRAGEATLKLAQLNVPHELPASLSAQNGPFMSPQEQNQQALAEKQERIAEMVRGMNGVTDAVVTINAGTAGVWANDQGTPSTASVKLVITPSFRVQPGEAKTIAKVVSGASGVPVSDVTLADSAGNDLLDADAATQSSAALTAQLQNDLDMLFGIGMTHAHVQVETNPGPVTVTERKRIPVTDRAIATDRLDERYKGSKGTFSRSHSTDDRGSDDLYRQTQTPAGTPQRVSVAIGYSPRLQPQRDAIVALAKSEVGFSGSRGDALAAWPVPSLGAAAAPAQVQNGGGASAPLSPLVTYAIEGALALAFVLALVLIARPIGAAMAGVVGRVASAQTLHETEAAAPGMQPRDLYERVANEPPHVIATVLGTVSLQTAAATLEYFEPERRREIVARLNRSATTIVKQLQSNA